MRNSLQKRTWAEVSLDNISHNYRAIRAALPEGCRFLGVVKADAYGHGAVAVARLLESEGADYLAVSCLDEAMELRSAGITMPLLILGHTPSEYTETLIDNDITQTVSCLAKAQEFSARAAALGRQLRIHIKIDTGMSRLGFQCDETHFEDSLAAICRVCALPGLDVEGIFTHFAVSDESEASCREYTRLQHSRFEEMIRRLEEKGVTFAIHHCANSGATVSYPQFAHDMFRPGIVTYGIGDQASELGLKPVMTFKTTVGVIKDYVPDTTISYGRTFTTHRPSRLGVLPIGYADGFHRCLSNKWRVWTPYGMAPIVGRICMDMCMIDLTDLPQVQEGDEVEVYGPHNSVNDAAHMAGTISYELTCAVSKRVPRIYYKGGKEIARELLLRG